jgi:hypothetical protein
VADSAIIYVTKVEAARRQINAAIRMSLLNQDDLAIHTVAAAAYRIVRDLLKKRGIDDFEQTVKSGLFSLAKAMTENSLSDKDSKMLDGDKKLHAIVSAIADRIKNSNTGFGLDEINLSDPSGLRRHQWEAYSKPTNFLKHADRDHQSAIAIDEIDNISLILRSCSAYATLAHDITPEMAIFCAWASLSGRIGVEDVLAQIAEKLKPLSPSQRRRASLKFIRGWERTFAKG